MKTISDFGKHLLSDKIAGKDEIYLIENNELV